MIGSSISASKVAFFCKTLSCSAVVQEFICFRVWIRKFKNEYLYIWVYADKETYKKKQRERIYEENSLYTF